MGHMVRTRYTLLFVIFFSLTGFHIHSQDYLAQSGLKIDPTKIIVKFDHSLSEEEIHHQLIQVSGISGHLVFLEAPELVIAYTDGSIITSSRDVLILIETIEAFPNVHYVGKYLKNENDYSFGILNEVFVKPVSAESLSLLNNLLLDQKVIDNGPYRFDDQIVKLVLDKNSSSTPFELAMELHLMDEFDFAEPNYLLNPKPAVNDPLFFRQWALENTGSAVQGNGTPDADMDVVEAWSITTGDPDIKIAIVDSGIDTLHPDLIDNILPGFDGTGMGSNGFPNDNYSSDGHGTACAGIAAAKGDNGLGVAGVAYDCSIIPVRVFYYVDTSFMGIPLGVVAFSTSEFFANGINWAWQNGADVQSHSWSVPDLILNSGALSGNPALVESAIVDATTLGRNGRGCPNIFSSGNDGDPPYWPGRIPAAMTVNTTSMCDEAKTPSSCDGQNWTGNWGANLDFGAPGVSIATTDVQGTEGFTGSSYHNSFNGTSASCPNAAGVIALILSVDPELTAIETRQILSETCDKVGGYNYDSTAVYGGWSPELGYGRINAHKAVLAASDITSVQEIDNTFIGVYPNPANGAVRVSIGSSFDAISLKVYDVSGLLLHEELTDPSSKEINVDLSNYSPGPKLLLLQDRNGELIVKKVLKIDD